MSCQRGSISGFQRIGDSLCCSDNLISVFSSISRQQCLCIVCVLTENWLGCCCVSRSTSHIPYLDSLSLFLLHRPIMNAGVKLFPSLVCLLSLFSPIFSSPVAVAASTVTSFLYLRLTLSKK